MSPKNFMTVWFLISPVALSEWTRAPKLNILRLNSGGTKVPRAHVQAAVEAWLTPQFEGSPFKLVGGDNSSLYHLQFSGTPALAKDAIYLRSGKFIYCIGE